MLQQQAEGVPSSRLHAPWNRWLGLSPRAEPCRAGSLTPPYITATGRCAGGTDSSHYYRGLRGKVHRLVMEMHGCPPGFSGFLVALSIYLAARKDRQKKKETKTKEKREGENAVVFGSCQVAVHWRRLFFKLMVKKLKCAETFAGHGGCVQLLQGN